MSLPAPVIKEEENGTKIITEYRYNDNGEIVKVTRKIKMVLSKQKLNHSAAERKKWNKFGSAVRSGGDSFKDGTTTLCEAIELKLSSFVDTEAEKAVEKPVAPAKKVTNTTISCRICKGDHWTLKCPYKDTLQPLDDLLGKSNEESTGTPESTVGSKPKYIPPSLRGDRASTASDVGVDRGSFRNRDENCIRVSSLSDDAREQDVRALFEPFGPISRFFLATDKHSGRCKGFAFITYRMKESAARAIEKRNGYGFDSLILKVEWAQNK